jgi:hypothetical protein
MRSAVRGQFEWKIIAKAWFYCWRQIVFGPRVKLWVPIPGIATHLDSSSLSPGIDWIRLMKMYPSSVDQANEYVAGQNK